MKLKACILAATAVAALASAAGAVEPIVSFTFEPIEGGYDPRLSPTSVYNSIPGPYAAFPAATGSLGFEDYTSVASTSPTFVLAQMRFVGGVSTAGESLRFQFFDATSSPFSSFTVGPLGAGNFIYTITLGTVALGGKDSTFVVPTIGELEIFTAGAGLGQFFLTATPPAVGSSSLLVGSTGGPTNTFNHAFELRQVPAPGALALLGLGGIVAARRRR